ncbi:ABC transporter permease [Sporosarcina sp. SAFN-015]|uniref:ABC transporter permease n=1 Tax=Sporosarcina sp. SAFN-015 TaxID=3387274 RepID=UPI003F7F6DB5
MVVTKGVKANEELELTKDLFGKLPDKEKNSEFIAVESKSYLADAWTRFRQNKVATISLTVLAIIILLAIFGPILSPYTYDGQDLENTNSPPSSEHIFGTDKFGRDIFVRVMYGARISLTVGFVSAFINLVVGIVYGGISGYTGGRTDMIMMRIIDILYAIPSILYVILIMLLFGPNIISVLVGICLSSWVGMARIVRGQVLSLKQQEFAMAAQVIGASKIRILLKHLILNSMGPILVTMTFIIPDAIFTEAYLSFLGVGIAAPMASWGTLAQDARNVLDSYPIQMFWPVAAICITMFALNFIGDTLNDALDPKKK